MLCCKVHSTPLPPHLTKSSGEDFFYVSFCIGVSIRIGREIRCLPYAGFFCCKPKASYITYPSYTELSYTSLFWNSLYMV